MRAQTGQIKQIITAAGGSKLRVFGSLATGSDREDSDIDLLFTMGRPLSLMELSCLEAQVSELVKAHVDLVPESSLRPHLRDRVLKKAVAL